MPKPPVEPHLAAVDVDGLVRNLMKITANLGQGIAAEAQKRAAALGKTYAIAADERIKAALAEAAIEIRRRDDVIAELQRQLRPRPSPCFRLHEAIKAALDAGEETIAVETLLAAMNAPAAPADGED